MKRIGIPVSVAFAAFLLAFSVVPRAAAQEEEHKQALNVNYPYDGVLIGKGVDAVMLRGPVHIEVFPLSPQVRKIHGDDMLVSEDFTYGKHSGWMLPLGKYEIHFTTRSGDETKTTIEPVVLGASGPSEVQVDFSKAKTYIIGESHTVQQLEGAIGELARRVAALQAEVAALKGGTKAAPATPASADTPTPTDTPAK